MDSRFSVVLAAVIASFQVFVRQRHKILLAKKIPNSFGPLVKCRVTGSSSVQF